MVSLSVKSNILGFKELQEKTDTLKAKKNSGAMSQGRNSITAVIPVKKLPKNGTKTGMMDKLLTILSSAKDDDFPDEASYCHHFSYLYPRYTLISGPSFDFFLVSMLTF